MPLVTTRAPASRQILRTMRRASSAVDAKWTWLPAWMALLLERLEVEIEMRQRVVLDVAALVAQGLELGQAGARGASTRGQSARHLRQRPLQLRVQQGRTGIALERRRGEGAHGAPTNWRVAQFARQHLGHVARGDFPPLARQLARHVHQAAQIAGKQHVRAGFRDMPCLALDDGVGDLGVLDREGAAEAAAHVGIDELHELQALDRAQELSRLLAYAQLPQARAAVVVGDTRLEGGIDAGKPAHVDEEGDELVHLGGEGFGARLPRGVACQQLGVVHFQHAGAGARRRHHVVMGFECRDGQARKLFCGRLVAGVVGGLAAAGLPCRDIDVAAGVRQQLGRSKSDRRPEQVDKASYEQADARSPSGNS